MATFVLVHGTGTGGWVWRRVRSLLVKAGHDVYAPTLTGVGERAHLVRRDIGLGTHVNDVVGVIDYEELRDVTLVGFCYGGMIIPAVADRVPDKVRRLIYLDAVVADGGQSLLDVMSPEIRDLWQRHVLAGDGWRLPPIPARHLGRVDANVTSEAEVRRLLARRTPQPLTCFSEPLAITRLDRELPTTFVHCTDKPPGGDMHGEFAASARARGWPIRELSAGHHCMLTMPGATASLLAELAAT